MMRRWFAAMIHVGVTALTKRYRAGMSRLIHCENARDRSTALLASTTPAKPASTVTAAASAVSGQTVATARTQASVQTRR